MPHGYTKEQISKMTPDELIDLDRTLQWSEKDEAAVHAFDQMVTKKYGISEV